MTLDSSSNEGTSKDINLVANNINFSGHIVPTANEEFDIGRADKKIRDIYVSSASIWIGDTTRVSADPSGTVSFRKRDPTVVPQSIISAGGSESGALTYASKSALKDLTLADWVAYGNSLNIAGGQSSVSNIYSQAGDATQWEETSEVVNTTSGTADVSYGTVNTSGLIVTGDTSLNSNVDISGVLGIGNYKLPTTKGVHNQVLRVPASGNQLVWAGAPVGVHGVDMCFASVDISGVLKGKTVNNDLSLGSHLIPEIDSNLNLGSQNNKFSKLFVKDISGTNLEISDISADNFTSNRIKVTDSATNKIAIGHLCGNVSAGNNTTVIGDRAGETNAGTSSISLGTRAGRTGRGSINGLYTIAIGYEAGTGTVGDVAKGQHSNAIAIGSWSGKQNQGSHSVSVGYSAGETDQGQYAIGLGYQSAYTSQGDKSIAIGHHAGKTSQSTLGIAIGDGAAYERQDMNGIAIGTGAARTDQSGGAVAIGGSAAYTNQGQTAVALGWWAGITNQEKDCIAIGTTAGGNNQGINSIAIGRGAAWSAQDGSGIAIGINTGYSNQGADSIAMGTLAGYQAQGASSIAIGKDAAKTTQGTNAIAIGKEAGETSQGNYSIAIGEKAADTSQGTKSVAIGFQAGKDQSMNAVAIGDEAGEIQGKKAIAIGHYSGNEHQQEDAVAIGNAAGQYTQGYRAISIGTIAGSIRQDSYGIAVGYQAGFMDQCNNAIAIGNSAGYQNQGKDSIAIGNKAGTTTTHNNTILLNATGVETNTADTSGLYINPIRVAQSDNVLMYNPTTKEVTTGTSINNASIDHFKTSRNLTIVGGNTASSDTSFTLAYSLDGLDYIGVKDSSNILHDVYDLLYDNSKNMWFAVGEGVNYSIAYSYDGIEWQGIENSKASNFSVRAHCLTINPSTGLIVAGGEGIRTAGYSSDGLNWTYIQIYTGTQTMLDVIYHESTGRFYGGFVDSAPPYEHIKYSTNGSGWSGINVQSSFSDLVSVGAVGTDGNKIVVGYLNANFGSGGNFQHMIYSNDNGSSWNDCSTNNNEFISKLFTLQTLSIKYANGIWIAGGQQYSSNAHEGYTIARSSDGIIWTGTSGTTDLMTRVHDVEWNGVRWVATGRGVYSIAYSDDNGITWYGVEDSSSNIIGECMGIGRSNTDNKNTFATNASLSKLNNTNSLTTNYLIVNEDSSFNKNLDVSGNLYVRDKLYGPSTFVIDPATIGDNTGTVRIKGNLEVLGTQTTINSTTVDLTTLNVDGDVSGSRITVDANRILMGYNAGKTDQSANAIAIGVYAGSSKQDKFTVALGNYAGQSNQATKATAIGYFAGNSGQGTNAIAIGSNAGKTNQPANSIVLNATGNILNGGTASSLFVDPIRNAVSNSILFYNSSTKEITQHVDASFTNNVDISNTLKVGYDANYNNLNYAISYIGNLALGNASLWEDWAGMSHRNNINKTDYGFIQRYTGATIVNCKNNQAIFFRKNNEQSPSAMCLNGTTGRLGIGTDTPGSNLDVIGSIWANKDTNTTSYFGRAAIGFSTGLGDAATFAHHDHNTDTNYALSSYNGGETFLNAADTKYISFRINNTDKMRLTTDGDFGIGTTSPDEKFHVYGSGNLYSLLETSGGNAFAKFKTNTGEFGIGTNLNDFGIYSYDDSVYRMWITDSGDVGFGTTSPAEKLHVYGSSTTRIEVESGGTHAYFKSQSSSRGYGTGTSGTDWKVYDYNAAAARICMNSSGDVGIATDSPTQVLDVSGDVRLRTRIYDSTNSAGTSGQVLTSKGNNDWEWTDSGGSVNLNSFSQDASLGHVDISGNIDISGTLRINGTSSLVSAQLENSILEYLNLTDGDSTNNQTLYDLLIDVCNVAIIQSSDVSMVNVDISGTLKGKTSNNQLALGSHIIPTTNAAYDLGNAEYKIRHLFLSDNSLWLGDENKIDISDGKIRFKKRKKTTVPPNISAAGGDAAGAIAKAQERDGSIDNISQVKIQDWLAYARTFNHAGLGSGVGNAEFEHIFTESPDLWDDNKDVTDADQSHITTVGTLTGLTMGGNLNLNSQHIINGGTIAGTLTTAAQTNVTSVGSLTGLTMAGALDLNNNNITNANNISGTIITAAQPNITSLGRLTAVKVLGNVDVSGNMHLSGGTSGKCSLILEADTDGNNNADTPSIEFRLDGGKARSFIGHNETAALDIKSSGGSGHTRFFTASSPPHTNGTQRMIIRNDGKIGIGVNAPQRLLDLGATGQITFGDNRNTDGDQGIYWHEAQSGVEKYGIYRTSGAWSSPDFQQLMIRFETGIILHPGAGAHGKSHVSIIGDISCSGVVRATGDISSSGSIRAGYNTDKKSYFGRAAIGAYGSSVNFASFAHIDCNNDNNSYALRQSEAGATCLNAPSGQYISFRINNSDKMRLDADGDFGIGLTNPTKKLEVVGDISCSGVVRATGDISSSGSILAGYDTNTTSYFGRAAIGYSGSNDDATFAHIDKNSSNNFALKQKAAGNTIINATSGTNITFNIGNLNKMRMDADGNLGIGLFNQTKKLEVVGDISASGGVIATGDISTNGAVSAGYDTNTTSYFGRAAIGCVPGWDWASFSHVDSNTQGGYALLQNSQGATLLNSATGQYIAFRQNNVTLMHLTSDGTLAINTNSPDSNSKLDVNGKIKTNQAVDTSSDDRLKHNEKNINNGLNIVRQLNPQFYQKTQTFKTHDYMGPVNDPYILEAGLIGQEVANINDISFAVSIGNDVKPYSVAYNNIFTYNIAATKELDAIVTELSNNLLAANNKIATLEQQNASIQTTIANQQTQINNLLNAVQQLSN